MKMKGNGMPGRLKKKPEYNPELQFNNFLQELRDAYEEADSLRSRIFSLALLHFF